MIIYVLIFLFPYSILAMHAPTKQDVVAFLMEQGKIEAESTRLSTEYANTKDTAFFGMLKTKKTIRTLHVGTQITVAAGCSFIERNFCGIPLSSLAEINWIASSQHIDGTTELKLMSALLKHLSKEASHDGADTISVVHHIYKQNILAQALIQEGFQLHHKVNDQQQIFWKKIKND